MLKTKDKELGGIILNSKSDSTIPNPPLIPPSPRGTRKKSIQGNGMMDKIEGRRGINTRDPNKTPPANHKTSAIMHDIKRAEIPCFPGKELSYVNQLQGNRHKHCIAQAIEL